MKNLTPFYLRFFLAVLLLTLLFRFALSHALTLERWTLAIACATGYGLTMFAMGYYFGKKDAAYLPLYDVGFRFHLATYIAFTSVSYLWFFFGNPAPTEPLSMLNVTATAWGIALFIHFALYLYLRNNSINGLTKEELFD